MKDTKNITDAYKKQNYMHKKLDICHSINVDSYKILCQKFFSASDIKQKYIDLAEDAVFADNEAEKEFILWLNREWQW